MSAIALSGISKKFSDTIALDSVSLNIEQGELFFLLGPSGCGKTTLLRILAGLCQADSGSILVNNSDLLKKPVEERNIGMVFQNYSLWPHMSVEQNIAYGLKLRNADKETVRAKTQDALAMVAMEKYASRMPSTLSGGQQQRVALARALAYDADIILLDEPLSNLDAKLRKEMRSEIQRLHAATKKTMVYVTHDQEEAVALASRMALMDQGKVVQTGTPEQMYSNPVNDFAKSFFANTTVLTGTVSAISGKTATIALDTSTFSTEIPGSSPLQKGASVTAMVHLLENSA